MLKQHLQHQINDKCQFDSRSPCLRHTLSPPCKIKNCLWRHVCRCAYDHIMTDEHCPNHHIDDEKLFKKVKGMNLYHAKRANKASKFDKWKPFNALYPNNTLNNQPLISNQKR